MNDIKEDSRFKSYLDESELESITLDDAQRTKFLDGETMVCEAQKVFMYTPMTEHIHKVCGVLTVTTFKLSFASAEDTEQPNCCQQNCLLGVNDLCLSSIDVIYQIGDRTKKRLVPGQSVSGKVKELLIVCKNMKYLEFSFKSSDKDSGKNIANSLLHHAYPKRHQLLFAYEYNEPYVSTNLGKEVRLFYSKLDWEKELRRTNCQNWRVSHVNYNYQVSPLLVETLIVPQSVTDTIIKDAVEKFRNRFCPVWVWGTASGAALVRMADILPTISDRTEENKLLEHIRKSHPERKQPHIVDLSSPTPKEINSSYLRLRELCTPDSPRTFKSQDFKFYGLLDSTRWLTHVSTCLTRAVEAAEQLQDHGCTVVLQEGNGQDLNCVVSSLTQIILDPYFRTKSGFQSLIQKDWVVLGHPFTNRLGHILSKEIEQSPIFLLFLDCVWQLTRQFPTAFQVSETYLTTVWDSAHVSVFDTFLFNCQHQRVMASLGNGNAHPPLVLRSVWDWREQFADRDIALFCNPLYDDSFAGPLNPSTGLSGLDVWDQCYFRWLSELEIPRGGRPQIDLYSRYLVSEIFQHYAAAGDVNGTTRARPTTGDDDYYLELLKKANGFFPFGRGGATINDVLLSGDALDSQSILNLNNE
ncbi:myotubularin-related protein 10-B [Cylas formicarius]|uniref:myotubularin-related protein 10-B n=1 Tax=Cylas formicarius TaxID=197179 RepID=UPI0029587E4E|nr:myotubularin-related protein 10-B [Cylas formicarius]XP_060525849.1 myotubularin-related protein 10-B [Cylas formicarius]XP_060525850.1 myotubularin-related protein 10-B [Cylas formicarius]